MSVARRVVGKRRRTQAMAKGKGDYEDTRCEECGSGEFGSELLLCDHCDRGFHLFCLRPILASVPIGSWFCPSCSSKSKSKSKSNQRKNNNNNNNNNNGGRGMAPRSANRPAAYEKGGMQLLSRQDTDALNLCSHMMTKGECPPLIVVFDPLEGFTVEADESIKDMTIITEYVGDVDYLQNRQHDDGDSIMTLICAANSSKSLVICPDKRSNIARFINGINNHTPEGRKKQNVKCVRFNVDGEARVLLVANRDISKGERLYYDYNAYENEYPTHHFV